MVMIDVVQEVVREAGTLFSNRKVANQVREKGACDYVTAVDEAVQRFIQQKLGELYPHIQFMGEEQDNSAIDMEGLVWVLDPVDGTTNLVHDYRNSAISLALLNNGEVVLGIIYNPFSNVNCFPSSRQSKKYKIFPASRYGLLAVFMQLT